MTKVPHKEKIQSGKVSREAEEREYLRIIGASVPRLTRSHRQCQRTIVYRLHPIPSYIYIKLCCHPES